ncbi:MAG: single-stranded-DNA-specific exonuclease RecJ [Elusimicrobia bacterium]|nr:single-stranded-DNA-specific exonuclease RecJ [Elusimicrobiota bacterium]
MKQWKIKEFDDLLIEDLSQKTGYSKIFVSLLFQKGIKTPGNLKKYIHPKISDLYNPFLFNNMEKAVNRIRKAILKSEKILIYGDRDVDGVTSVSIVFLFLKELDANVIWYIPLDEGYGLSKKLIEKYHNENVKLIITVDCGITAVEEVEFANSLGIDVIITDHHEAAAKPPEAIAIIDPKCPEEKYPFKELAGCGVAFKFCQALSFSYSKYYNKDIVVFDVETTGLSSLTDEIVEIGAVKIRNFIQTGNFSTLVKPKSQIPENVTAIHGISNEDCENAPAIYEVLGKFMDFTGDSILVAHNSDFDMSFLYSASEKTGKKICNQVMDTLAMARMLFPAKSYKLGMLANDLNIEVEKCHRASNDAVITSKIFEQLVMMQEEKQNKFIDKYLYFVALGTIADIVPLVSENRIFVKYGLPLLYNSDRPGIKAMLDALLIDKNAFTANKLSWSVIPILNSAGRYGKADLSIELLTTNDKNRAEKLFDEILILNGDRKALQKINIKSFIDATIQQNDMDNDKILVTVVEGLKRGVTGIAANQILREFNRPVILFILEGDEAVGSARSINDFNIVSIIEKCKDIVVKYGGHKAAAGLTVMKSNLDNFVKRIKFIAKDLITEKMLVSQLSIDTVISASDVSLELVKEIGLLEPCGCGNEYAIFALNDVVLSDFTPVGVDGAHLRVCLKNGKVVINGIGWQLGRRAVDLRKGQKIDLAFNLELNVWQSKESAQLKILDIKSSDSLF